MSPTQRSAASVHMPCFWDTVLPCKLITSAAVILVFSISSFGALKPMNGLAAVVEVHGEASGQVQLLAPQHAAQAPDAAEGQYLMLISAHEGLAAWGDILYEMLDLARELNRTLVEPCVRSGRITPCAPGRVVFVPTAGAVTAEDDPLNLPSSLLPRMDRAIAGSQTSLRGLHSYPLRVYVDLDGLRAQLPRLPVATGPHAAGTHSSREAGPIIRFDAWAAAALDANHSQLQYQASSGMYEGAVAYGVVKPGSGADGKTPHPPYVFRRHVQMGMNPKLADRDGVIATMLADASQT
jgi:hypothetical protein